MLEGVFLAHPHIAFRLTYNGTEQLVTDRSTSQLDTIARIYGAGLCTRCRGEEFYSYRREGAAAGRMISLAGIRV